MLLTRDRATRLPHFQQDTRESLTAEALMWQVVGEQEQLVQAVYVLVASA
jgi:hypothetical protein